MDLSEFAVYTDAAGGDADADADADRDRDATADAATPLPTVAADAGADGAPSRAHAGREAVVQARRVGQALDPRHRALPEGVRGHRDADRRRRDRPQAAHAKRTLVTVKRTLKAGSTTFTVKVSGEGALHEGHENQSHVDGAFRYRHRTPPRDHPPLIRRAFTVTIALLALAPVAAAQVPPTPTPTTRLRPRRRRPIRPSRPASSSRNAARRRSSSRSSAGSRAMSPPS